MGAVYGLLVAATLLAAWASDSHVCQKLGLLLLFDWAATNLAVNYMGFEQAPLLVPTLDGIAAILVAMVGLRNGSRAALAVFCLYGLVGLVHVVGFASHNQGTYTYYAALNVLFLLQLITVGGTSAARITIRARVPGRDKRLRPDPARR